MPKKKFEVGEDAHYDPFAAENKRAAIRAAVAPVESAVAEPESGAPLELVDIPRVATPAKVEQAAPIEEPERLEEPAQVVPNLVKPSAPEAPRVGERLLQGVQKRFRVSQDEEAEFEAFVLRLRKASASKVDFSVLSRSMWSALQHAENEILEELKRVRVPKRPAKHDTLGLAEYEERWVRLLVQAMRRMAPVK